jgi:hypothetical protein
MKFKRYIFLFVCLSLLAAVSLDGFQKMINAELEILALQPTAAKP